MEKEYFYVPYSRENFEYYAGHGMRKSYALPEEFTPLSQDDFGFYKMKNTPYPGKVRSVLLFMFQILTPFLYLTQNRQQNNTAVHWAIFDETE